MRATFLHMADCHLGYRQYNSRERQNDFTRAYLEIIGAAIGSKVDFVLLAGDLFERRAIDPITLSHAITGLERLKEAGIPCLAVEGNHELAYYRDSIGWVRFLAERELLVLLNPHFDGEEVGLPPYERREGAYVEPVPGLRVYGMRYYGSAAAPVVQRVAGALAAADRQGVEYTIFIAHAGVERVLDHQGGALSHRELAPLRPHVDYLALGHFHKPFEFDDWIYNPGSPETNSLTEAAWPERGYYLVEVDTEAEPKHRPVLHANPRRAFERLFFRVDACETPADLVGECRRYIERQRRQFRGKEPVVELRLSGVLPFDRGGLDLKRLEQVVEEQYKPLLSFVRDDTRASEFAVGADQHLGRRELERQIIAGLLERDNRFRDRSSAWTELTLAIKQLAVSGASADAILEELARGEERVRQGEETQC
ncbi:MAG: exonuclease SbcCD subunit D [Caldilineaceae bacterium]|nr:exonuclease SbcCD subunit D [Caldilineaceae bacterium]